MHVNNLVETNNFLLLFQTMQKIERKQFKLKKNKMNKASLHFVIYQYEKAEV